MSLVAMREAGYTLLIPPKLAEARYVRFVIAPRRFLSVGEVQVLDSVTCKPFDLRIALPDRKDRSDINAYNPKHVPSKSRKPGKT